ncbi:hypothetical protein H4J51_00120 [Colwellia sp. MB02u-18]|uniref:hypothetical protein n=1 Tax=unclassified Colwellia TaxID=196834 RepID=UPI0015F4EB8B|nr:MULTISPECIES: hypothetical protein [unclassified Colwellia]MBA6225186.1 hypothetical protein [Colwellia sp. MB3u-45]MBA6266558.1 hypothetical protein [Colwellia sp. MB3u-43]MBA6319611.1 hypothetical protein [Colwellia sp. MB02u-19]MBA6322985.1 hypothetical protein [Colwellia sp. MB02u-18]MBA6329686.1 hypothetical protein [Colwellia sp. MB02u-12]
MFKSFWQNPTSELANVLAFIFAFFMAEFAFYKLNFNYLFFPDSFDPLYFVIKIITILVFYQIWIKFFNWLYSK